MCDFWHFSKSFDTCGLASSVVKVFLPATQSSVGPGLETDGFSTNPEPHLQREPSHTRFAPVHAAGTHSENNRRSCFCPNWHEGGHFLPPLLLESVCVSWFVFKHFKKRIWMWKLTSVGCFDSLSLIKKWPKVVLKMSIFFCSHSSCQLGLICFQLCWILQTTDLGVSKDSESYGKSNNTHL